LLSSIRYLPVTAKKCMCNSWVKIDGTSRKNIFNKPVMA